MHAKQIKEGVHWVGAIDWDRTLFDALIPLPDGTSYNAYLVQGKDKTALIETVDPEKTDVLLTRLDNLGVQRIDYIIANHAEQDHTGSLPVLLDLFPEARVVTLEKCKGMLIDLLALDEDRFQLVEDGDALDLGGRTLEFIQAAWVHWPETMLTYLREDKILFPCDLFGSHLATNTLFVGDQDRGRVLEAAKRYYGEIMMPFATRIAKHLAKLAEYEIETIAPSHGPVHDDPGVILDAYKDWVTGDPKNLVALPYISMHASTQAMVDYLMEALVERGVRVAPYNLEKTDLGKLAADLVDAATIVVGTPTVLGTIHPNVTYGAALINLLRPKARQLGVIGSYGWHSKAVQRLQEQLPNLKSVEILEPVLAKGYPDEEAFQALDRLADTIVEKHQGLA